ncbi:MAG TPA: DNA repair protein RadA [Flavobacteriales bacterium]|nr:DNA repair protein RadA [Flavobacteriales bacterium]HIN39580.1 DNA repair protein RadA [Flavobacteriales bacterium]
MAKTKSAYFCQNCGVQSPKWIGKCSSCNEWNTYVEEIIQSEKDPKSWASTNGGLSTRSNKPNLIADISSTEGKRINTSSPELNRLLGGGLVPGSIILLGGEPGIGKSTLMLQVALNLKNLKVLYISGEESEHQIKMRAERVGPKDPTCYILTETSTHNIFQQIKTVKPDLVIVDSIQTLHTSQIESSPGSVSQIRECAAELQRFAKETETPVILIGHITKEGSLAGPKILEHMVDTVLQFEGNLNHLYRILRASKNRFGSTSELGIYEMTNKGMVEVTNPSEVFLSQSNEQLSGTAITASVEGIRPLLIEIQALVSTAAYGTPQRSSTGFDLRRLGMLLAVLEKKCGFMLATKDVFLNIAGGLKVNDPATDLGVISAILSSNEDIPIPTKTCFTGEISLTGEIRPATRLEQRILEAEKLGFERIYISKYSQKGLDVLGKNIEIIPKGKIEEVFSSLF